MKHRLILHIGAHRTATSALQEYLFQNFIPLQTKGFFYAFRVRRHLKLMNDLFAGRRQTDEVARRLIERMQTRPEKLFATEPDLPETLHTVILSDEDICMREDLSVLAGFRKHFDVKIAFTLRRQDTWLESWFFQNIKWQWNKKLSHCTFEEFLAMRADFHWIHYDQYIRRLEDLFGRENILLNVLEKQQMPQGPIEAFCDSIGLHDRSGFHPAAHINQSYSPPISEFMRCLPLGDAPAGYRNMLTQACARIDQQIHGGPPQKQSERLLPHAERAALMAEYEAGNRALAQRYFNRDALFLEPLPGPGAPLADMALPADTYELMDKFVAPLLKAVIQDHRKTAGAAEDKD